MAAGRSLLIGRRAERRWLQERLRRAHEGSPQCVLLTGPAGIGKTRLAADLRVEARGLGFVTLLGRAHEGVGVPLLVFRDGVLPGVARLLDDGSGPPAPVAELHSLTTEPSERADAVATMLL